ncbi:MAG: 4Fe-4S dicluster domain-containing protein [Desulfovibrionales bacterium]
MTISRRNFLKSLGLGSAALALPAKARAMGVKDETSELVTLIDLNLCIGCGACVDACKESNGHKFPKPEKPFPAMRPNRVAVEDWSDRQDETERLTPYNWLMLQHADVEYRGETHTLHVPRRCLHCQNPPCANLCPWGSASQQENGIVRIDDATCLGGAKCRMVCPWSIPQRQTGVGLYLKLMPSFAGNGVMYKCDRCFDRIEKGEQPACIEICPVEAQIIGPRPQIVAEARKRAEETGGFLYGLEENGGTNTIYLSPVPFDLLDQAIEKGPGKPHLAAVENSMALEENLGWAALIAPVAGLTAGLLKTGRFLFKGEKDNA